MTEPVIVGWGLTHPGRVRTNNEDAFLVDLELSAFAVSDGMGGRAAGEVASQMAIEGFQRTLAKTAGLRRSFLRTPSPERAQQLLGALRTGMLATHQEIFDCAKREAGKRGMGCTFTGLLLLGRQAFLVHVGDSRAYLLRGKGTDRVQLLTLDHTVANFLVSTGQEPKDSTQMKAVKHILTNALGSTPGLQVDGVVLDILPGDVFLLCSDGLHEYLPDEEEIATFWDQTPGAACCEALIQAACARGGKDNVTAVLARVPHLPTEEEDWSVCDVREELRTFANVREQLGLSSPEFLQLLSIATIRTLPQGETVLDDQEPGVGYLILKGELTRHDKKLNRREGSFLGARTLASARKPPHAWIADTESRVLVFHRETVQHLCFSQPALGARILWGLLSMES